MTTTSVAERRREPRRAVYLPVHMRREDGALAVVQTLTKDLAMGGMRCLSPRPMPGGASCAIELSVRRGEEPLILTGRVVWFRPIEHSEQFELGVSFDGLLPETQRRLSTYLEQSSARQRRAHGAVALA